MRNLMRAVPVAILALAVLTPSGLAGVTRHERKLPVTPPRHEKLLDEPSGADSSKRARTHETTQAMGSSGCSTESAGCMIPKAESSSTQ